MPWLSTTVTRVSPGFWKFLAIWFTATFRRAAAIAFKLLSLKATRDVRASETRSTI